MVSKIESQIPSITGPAGSKKGDESDAEYMIFERHFEVDKDPSS
jgi:hypothetical protein